MKPPTRPHLRKKTTTQDSAHDLTGAGGSLVRGSGGKKRLDGTPAVEAHRHGLFARLKKGNDGKKNQDSGSAIHLRAAKVRTGSETAESEVRFSRTKRAASSHVTENKAEFSSPWRAAPKEQTDSSSPVTQGVGSGSVFLGRETKVDTQLLTRLEEREASQRRVRRKRFFLRGVVFAVVVVAGLVVFVSPLTAYRLDECQVLGAKTVDVATICQASADFAGIPLTRLSSQTVVRNILSKVPALKSVEMQRKWLHGISFRVRERVPVATVKQNGKVVGVDRDAVVLEVAPGEVSGLPRLDVDLEKLGGNTKSLVSAALHSLGDMPLELHSRIAAVTSQDSAQLRFSLRNGGDLVWGNDQKAELKAKVALLLLSQPGVKTVDVSVPERPSTL